MSIDQAPQVRGSIRSLGESVRKDMQAGSSRRERLDHEEDDILLGTAYALSLVEEEREEIDARMARLDRVRGRVGNPAPAQADPGNPPAQQAPVQPDDDDPFAPRPDNPQPAPAPQPTAVQPAQGPNAPDQQPEPMWKKRLRVFSNRLAERD